MSSDYVIVHIQYHLVEMYVVDEGEYHKGLIGIIHPSVLSASPVVKKEILSYVVLDVYV